MEKSIRQFEGKGTLRGRILDKIKKNNSVKLSELIKLGNSRQSVLYHIKRLHDKKKIRAFIKGAGLTDEDLYFSIAPGDYPQEIQEIKKIIDDMRNGKSGTAATAYDTFFNVCIEKEVPRDDAIKLAHALISEAYLQLKEVVAFGLTYNNKIKNPLAGKDDEPDMIEPPLYFEKGEWHQYPKSYDYFINLLNVPNFISSLPGP